MLHNDDFFHENEELEKLYSGGFDCEGPAMHPTNNKVYFSDINFSVVPDPQTHRPEAGKILAYDTKKKETKIYKTPSGKANGNFIDRYGKLYSAQGADYGGRQITMIDIIDEGRCFMMAGAYNGRLLNSPNDLVVDKQGRIYFTDPRYGGFMEMIDQPCTGVYRIETNGTVSLLIADVLNPNGIALSPDEKTLYVSSLYYGAFGLPGVQIPLNLFVSGFKGPNRLVAYKIKDDGTLSFKKILHEFPDDGGFDGISVDKEGNIWGAMNCESQPSIQVFSPEGELRGYCELPAAPSNCCFGIGDEKHSLFITTGHCASPDRGSLFKLKVKAEGYFPY